MKTYIHSTPLDHDTTDLTGHYLWAGEWHELANTVLFKFTKEHYRKLNGYSNNYIKRYYDLQPTRWGVKTPFDVTSHRVHEYYLKGKHADRQRYTRHADLRVDNSGRLKRVPVVMHKVSNKNWLQPWLDAQEALSSFDAWVEKKWAHGELQHHFGPSQGIEYAKEVINTYEPLAYLRNPTNVWA